MSYPTSRKFPRSLAEAFPRAYAEAIERYSRPRFQWRIAVCLTAAVLIGSLMATGF